MITRIVKMSMQESHVDDFKQYIEKAKDDIRAFEGCKHLEILNDKNDPTIFFSYSIWVSEPKLKKYLKSDLLKEIWPIVKKWFAKPAQAWSVENLFDQHLFASTH